MQKLTAQKPLKAIVKKNGTFEFHANLRPQSCTDAQEMFYVLSFMTCALVILQILFLFGYFCFKRFFCRESGNDKNEEEKIEDEVSSE